MKLRLMMLLGLTVLFVQGISPEVRADDALKSPRDAFAKAYSDMKYDGICAVLHPDASFRGSLHPERWSHTANNIVKERWNVNSTCDCGANIGQCKHAGAGPQPQPGLQPLTVGQSDMLMTPDPTSGSVTAGIYSIDTGTFTMKPKAGVSSQAITNPYVIIWANTAAAGQPPSWKMMHIDMHPCGEQPGACK